MRLRPALVLCVALCAAALAPASALGAGASLTRAAGAKFPSQAFVLTLPPGVAPSADQIRLQESGRTVSDLTISNANTAGQTKFAVMLVIDSSPSMRGKAIGGAMAAARAFAEQRPAAQPLGVVTFDGHPTVLLEPTTDAEAIRGALAGAPPIGRGTFIYGAVAAALKQLDRPQIDAGAVVVLSDGCHRRGQSCRDSRNAATSAQIAAAARKVHARVFSIGLRSPSFDSAELRDVATLAGGEYLGAATASRVEGIYRELGGQLANAYVLRYRSLARPGTPVAVVAEGAGHRASTTYLAPRLSVQGATSVARQHESFFATAAGIAVVTLGFLALAFVAFALVLVPQQRKGALHRRIHEYGLPSQDAKEEPVSHHDRIESIQSSLRSTDRWKRLEESLEIGRVQLTAGRFMLTVVGLTVILTWLLVVLTGSVMLAVFGLFGVPLAARAYVRSRVSKQRTQFADQLADAMQAVGAAMRTGHSFVGALSQLVENAGEPTATEFRRVVADERLGVPLEDAFRETVRRMDNRDVEQVALIAVLQRETGGNGAEALDRVVENLRARDEVRRLVKTLTAQGRMARWVLTALPVMLLLLLTVIGDGYTAPLFESTGGNLMLGLAAALVVTGSVVIEKIIQIDV